MWKSFVGAIRHCVVDHISAIGIARHVRLCEAGLGLGLGLGLARVCCPHHLMIVHAPCATAHLRLKLLPSAQPVPITCTSVGSILLCFALPKALSTVVLRVTLLAILRAAPHCGFLGSCEALRTLVLQGAPLTLCGAAFFGPKHRRL